MSDAIADLCKRFVYRPDKSDKWTLLAAPTGALRGDCEDFALTALWLLSGKSWRVLWWRVTTGRAMIWHVKADDGSGHVCLWVAGRGWICNIYPQWSDACRHRRVFPIIAPLLAAKLLLK